MDWEEQLFSVLDDLEQQAEALYAIERDVELLDRSRAEYGAVTLASRLMASLDQELTVRVRGVGTVAGTLRRVAAGWLLLTGGAGQWVVPLASVASVAGASQRSVPEVAWSPVTRLGLASVLRRLSEVGEPCLLHLTDGSRREGAVRRVGADFAEIEVGRQRVELVAFGCLAAIQSGPGDAGVG